MEVEGSKTAMRAQKCQGRKPLYSLGNSWGRGEPGVPVLLYGRQESAPPPIALSSQFSDLGGYWLSQDSDEEFCHLFLLSLLG